MESEESGIGGLRLGEGLGFLNDFGPAFVEGLEEFLVGKALESRP